MSSHTLFKYMSRLSQKKLDMFDMCNHRDLAFYQECKRECNVDEWTTRDEGYLQYLTEERNEIQDEQEDRKQEGYFYNDSHAIYTTHDRRSGCKRRRSAKTTTKVSRARRQLPYNQQIERDAFKLAPVDIDMDAIHKESINDNDTLLMLYRKRRGLNLAIDDMEWCEPGSGQLELLIKEFDAVNEQCIRYENILR